MRSNEQYVINAINKGHYNGAMNILNEICEEFNPDLLEIACEQYNIYWRDDAALPITQEIERDVHIWEFDTAKKLINKLNKVWYGNHDYYNLSNGVENPKNVKPINANDVYKINNYINEHS